MKDQAIIVIEQIIYPRIAKKSMHFVVAILNIFGTKGELIEVFVVRAQLGDLLLDSSLAFQELFRL